MTPASRERGVETPDCVMSCFEQGNGPPIVFVHGNASTHATWQPTVESLRTHYRCITYDLRCHGTSEGTSGSFSMARLVDDLEDVRKRFGLERFRLVGHSLGAMIAASYALENADRLKGLCLLAMPAGRTQRDRAAGKALIDEVNSKGVRGAMGGLVARWYTDAFVATHPGLLEKRLDQFADIDRAVFLEAYKLYLDTELGPRLGDIAVPTLVLTGQYASGCNTDTARYLGRQIPGSEVHIFPEMKNGILTEIPTRVAAKIHAFFSARTS